LPSDPPLGEPLDRLLAGVRLAAFDADGVLTDGRFLLLSDGRDGMRFCTRDGLGLKLLQSEGVAVAVISARRSGALARRAELLGLRHLRQGAEDKGVALREIAEAEGVPQRSTLFMGDDLPDLVAFASAGVRVAPADAVEEVRARADLVTIRPAGRGAVREVAERILRAAGRYEAALARFTGGR
jgi:3-deoxy-D-manno-octulosonate 8-phosphate phosphatase (KDO 8-P phosphatase)